MKDLCRGAFRIALILLSAPAAVILLAWLSSVNIISEKAAVVLIFSLPMFWCIGKVCVSLYLMKYGLPATGYFSAQSRTAHLRYYSGDSIERKGACDLLTRRSLRSGRTVPVWYDPSHPQRFTTGQNEIIVNVLFCILFAVIPVYLIVRL